MTFYFKIELNNGKHYKSELFNGEKITIEEIKKITSLWSSCEEVKECNIQYSKTNKEVNNWEIAFPYIVKSYYGYRYTYNAITKEYCYIDNLLEGIILESENEYNILNYILDYTFRRLGQGKNNNEVKKGVK